jgi:hypothetical protein
MVYRNKYLPGINPPAAQWRSTEPNKGGSLAYELLCNYEHLSLHLAQQLMQTCAVFYMGALASDASVTAVLDLQWCFSTLQLVDVAGFDLKVCSDTDGTRKLILQHLERRYAV